MRFLRDTIDVSQMLAQHPKVRKFQLVGSSLIDEETAKDLDVLVLVEGTAFLTDARWAFGPEWDTVGGRYDDQTDQWGSVRKGVVNLIVTVDPAWYDRAALANEVCVALKLKDKGDRIVTYRVVRDGYSADDANARRDGRR